MTKSVIYNSTSPYSSTQQVNKYVPYLDFWPGITIAPAATDTLITLPSLYQYRPDSLSYDVYNTPNLWWVFAVRNLNVINDPIWDFVPGINIYIPDPSSLTRFT